MKIKNDAILKGITPEKRTCIVGIGNFDRADDYAGIAVIEALTSKQFSEKVVIINAGPVPEAFTGVIKRFKPDLLIIIDAALMEEKPGTIRVFTEKDIDEAYMITPHRTSMTMYMKYLRFFLTDLEGIFIGIQPTSLSYGLPLCDEVKKSVTFLARYLNKILSKF